MGRQGLFPILRPRGDVLANRPDPGTREGDRSEVVRGQERTTLPQIQQHERVETGTTVLEYPLERTRRAESGGRKGNRRGPSELVHLEPEGTRSGGEDRNSVDDSGRNLRCSGPQT